MTLINFFPQILQNVSDLNQIVTENQKDIQVRNLDAKSTDISPSLDYIDWSKH